MRKSKSRSRLCLFEHLETRDLLAELTWIGGVNDNWHNGANWNAGIAPDNGDVAILEGGTIKLYAAQTKDIEVRARSNATTLQLNNFDFTYRKIKVGDDRDNAVATTVSVFGPGAVIPSPPAPPVPGGGLIEVGAKNAAATAQFIGVGMLEFDQILIGGVDDVAGVRIQDSFARGGLVNVGIDPEGQLSELAIDGSVVELSGTFFVGLKSEAEATIKDSTIKGIGNVNAFAGDVVVGDAGEGTLTAQDSEIRAAKLSVAKQEVGRVFVEAGSNVTVAEAAWVGFGPGVAGVMEVKNLGTTFDAKDIIVGHSVSSNGSLKISDRAEVVAQKVGVVGYEGFGAIEVSGSGTKLNVGELTVGWATGSSGELTVKQFGRVDVTDAGRPATLNVVPNMVVARAGQAIVDLSDMSRIDVKKELQIAMTGGARPAAAVITAKSQSLFSATQNIVHGAGRAEATIMENSNVVGKNGSLGEIGGGRIKVKTGAILEGTDGLVFGGGEGIEVGVYSQGILNTTDIVSFKANTVLTGDSRVAADTAILTTALSAYVSPETEEGEIATLEFEAPVFDATGGMTLLIDAPQAGDNDHLHATGSSNLGGAFAVDFGFTPAPWRASGAAGDWVHVFSADGELQGEMLANLPDFDSLPYPLPTPAPGAEYQWKVIYDRDDVTPASGIAANQPWLGNGTHDVIVLIAELGGYDYDPVAENDEYSLPAGADAAFSAPGVLWNDAFAQEVQLVSGPNHATTFQLNANGSWSYTAQSTFDGYDSFTYRAVNTHNDKLSAPATVMIRVYRYAPEAAEDNFNLGAGASAWNFGAPGVLENDEWADAAERVEGSGPSHGTLVFNADGSFTYTPDVGFTGEDSFEYVAIQFGSEQESEPTTVRLHVSSSGPQGTIDGFLVPASSDPLEIVGDVLANDSLANAAVLASGPAHGDLTFEADGSFLYIPDEGFVGVDYFYYRAVNLGTGQQSGLVYVAVSVVQVEAVPDVYATKVNVPLNVGVPYGAGLFGWLGVLYNDQNENGAQLVSDGGPSHGSLNFSQDGSFSYAPHAGYTGMDVFHYRAVDEITGELSPPTSVTIWVLAEQPSGLPHHEYTVAAGYAVEVSPANGLFSNDPWADAIIFVNGTGPQHGNVSGGTIAGSSYYGGFHYEHQHRNSDGTFEYGLISTGFTGAEGFQYVALNKTTGQSALRTGRINVIGPIANDDYAWNTAGNDAEGNMLSNDQWADDFEIVSGPSHGEFYFLNEETGDFVYRPNEGFEGEDSFQYRALNTAFGLQSAVATVTIQIGYDPLALNRPAVVSNEPILVMSQLLAITDEAVRRWNAAGVSRAILDQALAQVEFVITDLPGSHIGGTTSDAKIAIDINAAGYGWFIDLTPGGDSEFGQAVSASERRAGSSSAAAQHADLLTVVMHELGHVLGLDHTAVADNIMAETIDLGTRRLATAADAALVDLLFTTRGRRRR